MSERSKAHVKHGFYCCGRWYFGNGGNMHRKKHLLQEMPEYRGSRHGYRDLLHEKMRREDLEDGRWGGKWAKKFKLVV